jgi:hypothetical protein
MPLPSLSNAAGQRGFFHNRTQDGRQRFARVIVAPVIEASVGDLLVMEDWEHTRQCLLLSRHGGTYQVRFLE